MNAQRLDLDPAPRRSPRLLADVGAIPHARPTSSLLRHKPTEADQIRLARDLAIYMVIEAGMSQHVAARAFGLSQPRILKVYRQMACRKSRV